MPEEVDIVEFPLVDLLGGLSNTKDAPLIADNEWQVATNVFFDEKGGARKRYGYVVGDNSPFTANTTRGRIFAFSSVGAQDKILYSDGSWTRLASDSTQTATWSYIGYTGAGGTALFTNGSTAVVRQTGTAEWTTQVGVGDQISGDNGVSWYNIATVTDNSNLVISTNYAQNTGTGAYVVRQQLNGTTPDAAMFQGKLYIGPCASPSSGTSGLMAYDGTETRRIASSPSLDNLCVHKNYIFGFNSQSATLPSRTFWCTLLDPTTWPASNFIDVSPNDGSKNRRLISFNDVLYIFRDKNIFYLVGEVFDPSNPTYALRRIINPNGIGTLHGRTCVTWNGAIFFLGQNGVFALQGVSNIVPISYQKINSELNGDGADTTNDNFASADVFDNKYWLANDKGEETFTAYTLDLNGAWSKHTFKSTDLRASGAALWGWDSSAIKHFVFSTSTTNDGASGTSATLTSKVYTFGDFTKTNHIHDLYLIFKNATGQSATVDIYDDNGVIGSPTVLSFTAGTTKFIDVFKIPVERDTNGFYFRITDSTASSTFTLYGAMITLTKDSRGSGKVIT